MAKRAKSFESADYEDVIERLTDQITRWRSSDEPADQFARRIVGTLRMEQKKWERKK